MNTPTTLLATATNAQLVAAFNAAIVNHSIDAKPTKKFASAEAGRARIMKLAETHGLEIADVNGELALVQPEQAEAEVSPEPQDPHAAEVKPLRTQIEEARAAREARAAAEPKAKKTRKTGGRRGPAPEFADDDHIDLATALGANPKKPGSKAHARFALYSPAGMTVAAYLAAGGTREDLRWDSKHGHIVIYTARQMANSAAGRDMEDDGEA